MGIQKKECRFGFAVFGPGPLQLSTLSVLRVFYECRYGYNVWIIFPMADIQFIVKKDSGSSVIACMAVMFESFFMSAEIRCTGVVKRL